MRRLARRSAERCEVLPACGHRLLRTSIATEPTALYTKFGDLSMQLSSQTTSPVDSGKWYLTAQTAWRRALTENASYVPARQRLLEEQYKIATFESRAERWTELEETAEKMTQLDKSYGKAFTYLAASRLALLQVASTMTLDVKQAKLVEGDIDRAMKEDPTSSQPVRFACVAAAVAGDQDAGGEQPGREEDPGRCGGGVERLPGEASERSGRIDFAGGFVLGGEAAGGRDEAAGVGGGGAAQAGKASALWRRGTSRRVIRRWRRRCWWI